MDPNSGRIIEAETPEELNKLKSAMERMLAGDDNAAVPISDAQLSQVKGMNRHERRKWAAIEREHLRVVATAEARRKKR